MSSVLDMSQCEVQDFCLMGERENFSCLEWHGAAAPSLLHRGSQPKNEADTRRRAEVKELQRD